MRVLWICNIMLPRVAKKLGQEVNVKEGWITGLMDSVLAHNASKTENTVQLGLAFPIAKGQEFLQDALIINQDYDVPFYGFREDVLAAEQYDISLETDMTRILEHFKPDIVHCFGTEYPHTLAAIKCFGKPERTLVGIQGLCRVCAKGYMANLPQKIVKSVTFRDIVRKDTLPMQQQKFEGRGQWELASIQGTGHVTGRTGFDKYWTTKWNPRVTYHAMNETLREEFYTGAWSYEACCPHRLFFSQGDYPLKGFHYMLLAMPKILQKYPDTEVYIAGNSLLRGKGLKARLKISAYGKYLESLISKYDLADKVHFLGRLTAAQMKEQYLKSQAFVCASSIENSPNSIGEAMILGVPVVAADVGGIPTMITSEEGTLFEGFRLEKTNDEKELFAISDRLAEAVCTVYAEESKTLEKAAKGKAHARRTHDREANNRRLIEIYNEMLDY